MNVLREIAIFFVKKLIKRKSDTERLAEEIKRSKELIHKQLGIPKQYLNNQT